MSWLKAIRPGTSAMAALLAFVAFASTSWTSMSLPVVFSIFVVSSATMVQNDYRDRFHDLKKGKSFALNHAYPFKWFVIILWSCCAVICFYLFFSSTLFGSLYLGVIVIGLLYSEILTVPFLPNFLVALTSGAGIFFAYSPLHSTTVVLLFVSIFLVIFFREIIKDLQDIDFDRGHKWTYPVVFGSCTAKNIIYVTSALLVPFIFVLVGWCGLICVSFLVFALYKVSIGDYTLSLKFLNIGMLLFMGFLCLK